MRHNYAVYKVTRKHIKWTFEFQLEARKFIKSWQMRPFFVSSLRLKVFFLEGSSYLHVQDTVEQIRVGCPGELDDAYHIICVDYVSPY